MRPQKRTFYVGRIMDSMCPEERILRVALVILHVPMMAVCISAASPPPQRTTGQDKD